MSNGTGIPEVKKAINECWDIMFDLCKIRQRINAISKVDPNQVEELEGAYKAIGKAWFSMFNASQTLKAVKEILAEEQYMVFKAECEKWEKEHKAKARIDKGGIILE